MPDKEKVEPSEVKRILSELGANIKSCEGELTKDGIKYTCQAAGSPLTMKITLKGTPRLSVNYDAPLAITRGALPARLPAEVEELFAKAG